MKVSISSPEDRLRLVTWPDELEVRPLIGERIASINNNHSRVIASIEHQVWIKNGIKSYVMVIELRSSLGISND